MPTTTPAETIFDSTLLQNLEAPMVLACNFSDTESKEKLRKRPPLYYAKLGCCYSVSGIVILDVGGLDAVVVKMELPLKRCSCLGRVEDTYLGEFYTAKKSSGTPPVSYTAPITAAMWAIINQWWKG